MTDQIRLKRSSTSGAEPTTAQLVAGEPAVNTADGALFFELDGGTIARIDGRKAKVDVFTSSGTWTKPAGAAYVDMWLISGGGGGGSGRRGAAATHRSGGGGGGGCAINVQNFPASALASTLYVTVGAGGTGGAGVLVDDTNGNNGTAGGESRVGTTSGAGDVAVTGVGNFGSGGQTLRASTVNGGIRIRKP